MYNFFFIIFFEFFFGRYKLLLFLKRGKPWKIQKAGTTDMHQGFSPAGFCSDIPSSILGILSNIPGIHHCILSKHSISPTYTQTPPEYNPVSPESLTVLQSLPKVSDTDIFGDQVTNFNMSRVHYTPSGSSLSVGTQRESSIYNPEINAGSFTDCNSCALQPFIPIPSQRGAKCFKWISRFSR